MKQIELCKLTLIILATAASLSSSGVTLKVKVPSGTPRCYVTGQFNNWDVNNAVELQSIGDDVFSIDLSGISVSDMEAGYKYVCGRAWSYVEKGSSGEEVNNRTSIGTPDVVATWASLYDPSVESFTVNINGYDRDIRILLPDDYEISDKNYPVVYYVGVGQRYSEAGGDNPGDDFFGTDSWNAGALSREMVNNGLEGVILVSSDIFVAEAIPFNHPDFMGSGATENYMKDWLPGVVEYVRSKYRTVDNPTARTIIGADLGGLFSIYASVHHPEIFGKCISISPMLWINSDQLGEMIPSSGSNVEMVLTYCSGEPEYFKKLIYDFTSKSGTASLREYSGYHQDIYWRAIFQDLYPMFATDGRIPENVSSINLVRNESQASLTAISSDCSFYYTESSSTPVLDSSVTFTPTDAYVTKSGNDRSALVLIKPISSSFKGTSYFNVYDNQSKKFLMNTNGKVSFSSKKTATSWIRVAVLDDGTVEQCSASSKGFTVKSADTTKTMSITGNYKTKASLAFTGSDKSFTIHYGSVNSQSDMGAVTAVHEVSADCLAADIEYDFLLNSVKITETEWGTPLPKVYVKTFSAVPSVTKVGECSKITIELSEGYTPTLTWATNYGTPQNISLTTTDNRVWHAELSNLSSGIHHLTMNARSIRGTTEEAGQIAIKVFSGITPINNAFVTVNAYNNVDWTTTGRYKSNFHTHTSQSFDTQFTTDKVVDRYKNARYSILALTDHDYNSYPWTYFDLFNPQAESRNPEDIGMLTFPGNELSKDNRNTWDEKTGGQFNHHNDFFTGRKGQEFASLRESYAYTEKLGGMQIINHPGQYWNLSTTYTDGEKNSPSWHIENFMTYGSLVGLEVYNQGNRRPNDRILWDQILDKTMPERPVWGYSGDDTHTLEQYFRNYNIMLMPELSTDKLKEAMKTGAQYFCYEFTGSGEAKAPVIKSIDVDNDAKTITIDTDADIVYWIFSTDKPSQSSSSARKSTVVGMGKKFDFSKYQGSYVRALMTNDHGETCTQPFGFGEMIATGSQIESSDLCAFTISLSRNPAYMEVDVIASAPAEKATIFSMSGIKVTEGLFNGNIAHIDLRGIPAGAYIVMVTGENGNAETRLIVR